MNLNRLIPLLYLALAVPAAAQVAVSPETQSPALSALKAGAANPDCAMSGVTGDACPGSAVAVPAGSTTTAKGDATLPAITHRQTAGADVPPPGKKKSGSFLKGVKDYFDDDMVKEGVAFGAMFGMLLLAAGPVGILGGALIGAAIGAVLCGGLIGKLFHKKPSA